MHKVPGYPSTTCKGLLGECIDCVWPRCVAATLYAHGELPPNYPLPTDIGRVSLGQDYPGVWFIDNANQDDPVMVWQYDTWCEGDEDEANEAWVRYITL